MNDPGEIFQGEYLNLATFRKSGVAVETPVWFAVREGRIIVFTDGISGKVKRLRNSDRVRVAPCTVSGRVTGAWHEGRGWQVLDPERTEEGFAALFEKYGWKLRLLTVMARLGRRVQRRVILEIQLSPGR